MVIKNTVEGMSAGMMVSIAATCLVEMVTFTSRATLK